MAILQNGTLISGGINDSQYIKFTGSGELETKTNVQDAITYLGDHSLIETITEEEFLANEEAYRASGKTYIVTASGSTINASDIPFSNGGTDLSSTTVGGALKELDAKGGGGTASITSGTKAEIDAKIAAGEIEDGETVIITDDSTTDDFSAEQIAFDNTDTGMESTNVEDAIKELNSEKYEKASTGIPKSDLESSVQTSLGLADSALQSHQDISGKQDSTDSNLNTNAKTVVGAINEVYSDLADSLTWALIGSATSTNTVSYDRATYKELYIKARFTDKPEEGFDFKFPTIYTDTQYINEGYTWSSANNLCRLKITASTVSLSVATIGGTDCLSIASIDVYGR